MSKHSRLIESVTITQTSYSLHTQAEKQFTLDKFLAAQKAGTIGPNDKFPLVWLHFSGIRDAETLEQVLAPYDIHELVIEDILNPTQRTKAEIYKGFLFIVGRTFRYHGHTLQYDQLFMIALPGLVLTFDPTCRSNYVPLLEHFEPSEREREDINAGFLIYALLDCIVDRFYPAVDNLLSRIEKHDRRIFSDKSNLTLNKAHKFKQDSIRIRNTVRKMNDTLNQITRWNNTLIDQHTKTYLRDLVDITAQMLDRLDYAREMIRSLTDTYFSLQSNELNLQIRLLTIITIMFMPLTLISGIYGMNFENMPELKWKYGYYVVLGVMILIVVILLRIFHRKKWL